MSNNIVWDGSTDIRLTAKLNYDKIVEQTAKRCANHLIATSPQGHRTKKNYKYGWRVTRGRKKDNESYVEVWNETNWQLTWLLENGHIIANKRGGVGWASAKPHIQMAVDYVRPQFLSEMEKTDIDIDFMKG